MLEDSYILEKHPDATLTEIVNVETDPMTSTLESKKRLQFSVPIRKILVCKTIEKFDAPRFEQELLQLSKYFTNNSRPFIEFINKTIVVGDIDTNIIKQHIDSDIIKIVHDEKSKLKIMLNSFRYDFMVTVHRRDAKTQRKIKIYLPYA